MNESYDDAKKRMKTNRTRLLELLMLAGNRGVTNKEIADTIGGNWSARKSDLVSMGYEIVYQNEGKGRYRYFLLSTPEHIKKSIQPLKMVMQDIEECYHGSITAEDLEDILHQRGLFISRKGQYPAVMSKNKAVSQ